ncbi:MAG: RHS repeat-associated core domain-containing protein [Kiritimatiellae bacterium]|nr:RHS repeat-associated core domain-containing protein [Kiritimatiellia bacterium]MBP9572992.1 RHS repeat-associated core domain-containing protein [Kiritimatiellia bacterium]
MSQTLNDCLTTRFVYDGANAVLEVSAEGRSAYGGNVSYQVIWAWVNAPDPHTGRFTSEDPLGFVDGPNRYVYAGNSPAKWIDPLGLEFHNNSGVNAWVKPELGDDPELVPPGGIYDKPFDGFSTPLNPCQVFKTQDGTDVWLFDTFVATSGSLSDLLKSEGGYQFLLNLLGPMTRLWKEGWKGQEWINEDPDKPKTDWQKLMDKSCESK